MDSHEATTSSGKKSLKTKAPKNQPEFKLTIVCKGGVKVMAPLAFIEKSEFLKNRWVIQKKKKHLSLEDRNTVTFTTIDAHVLKELIRLLTKCTFGNETGYKKPSNFDDLIEPLYHAAKLLGTDPVMPY